MTKAKMPVDMRPFGSAKDAGTLGLWTDELTRKTAGTAGVCGDVCPAPLCQLGGQP